MEFKSRLTQFGLIFSSLITMSLLLCTLSIAEVPNIDGSVNIYSSNNYFWRADGDGDPHLQYDFGLSTSVSGIQFSLSPWVSHNLDTKDVDEVDYTIDLGYSIANVSANTGVIYYDVTGVDETAELYGAVGYELVMGDMLTISPGLTFYYDFAEVDKPYLETSMSVGADQVM